MRDRKSKATAGAAAAPIPPAPVQNAPDPTPAPQFTEEARVEFLAALKALGDVRRMPGARLSDRQHRARVRQLQRQRVTLLRAEESR